MVYKTRLGKEVGRNMVFEEKLQLVGIVITMKYII